MLTKGQVKVPSSYAAQLRGGGDRRSSGGAAYMQLFKGEGKGGDKERDGWGRRMKI